MFRHIQAAAVAGFVLAGAPALASAQSISYSTSPVTLTSCRAVETYDAASFAGLSELSPARLYQTSGIALNYVNKSSVPATAISVVFNDGTRTQQVTARGSFAPNVQIERTVETNVAAADTHPACSVAAVQFADGSAWHADRRDLVQR